jgi:hypothetical protein
MLKCHNFSMISANIIPRKITQSNAQLEAFKKIYFNGISNEN